MYIAKIKVQANNKILIAGNFNYYDDIYRPRLVRLNEKGELDISFAPMVDRDMEIYVVELQFNGQTVGPLLHLNNDGSLDGSFIPFGAQDRRFPTRYWLPRRIQP